MTSEAEKPLKVSDEALATMANAGDALLKLKQFERERVLGALCILFDGRAWFAARAQEAPGE